MNNKPAALDEPTLDEALVHWNATPSKAGTSKRCEACFLVLHEAARRYSAIVKAVEGAMVREKLLGIEEALIRCANIIDVTKQEWQAEGAWSEWDQETRSLITQSIQNINKWSTLEKSLAHGIDAFIKGD